MRTCQHYSTLHFFSSLLDRRADKYTGRPRFVMGGELMTSNKFLLFTQPGPLCDLIFLCFERLLTLTSFNRLRRAAHDGLNSRIVKQYRLIQEREAVLLALNLMTNPSDLHAELQRYV